MARCKTFPDVIIKTRTATPDFLREFFITVLNFKYLSNVYYLGTKNYKDLIKYGIESFTITIVEKFNSISDIELKNKETYYMNLYNSLDRTIGYNIRQDINGKYICSDSTKEIKRLQTSKQWADGITNLVNNNNLLLCLKTKQNLNIQL